MIKGFLEFFREKKPEIVRTAEVNVKIHEAGGYCSTCWYPSEYELRDVEIVALVLLAVFFH